MPSTVGGAREAWHCLLQVSSRMLRELDAALDREHRISVNEFDVLITLDNVPGRRLRMTDLARSAMLSSGGLTRLVGRLEDRALIRREPDPADARAFLAGLTEAGAALLASARVTHDAVIEDVLGSKLSPDQLAALTRALSTALGD